MSDWSDFYKGRVKSERYETYFKDRYAPFLEYITSQVGTMFFEVGCGISSVSKALLTPLDIAHVTDKDKEMLFLSLENLVGSVLSVRMSTCDATIRVYPQEGKIAVTHGLLEHFEDSDILKIVSHCPEGSIHYVPLDKYTTPSFGDERLLPFQHWVDLVKPTHYFLFNDGHDLCFKK